MYPSAFLRVPFALGVLTLAACALELHEPTVDQGNYSKPWQVHCETGRTHDVNTGDAPGARSAKWLFAKDKEGAAYHFDGKLVDGFLEVESVYSANSRVEASRLSVRKLCIDTIKSRYKNEDVILGWVMAARANEKVNIPPVYLDNPIYENGVSRVVIFGDSLTDTGRLKKRLKVFPANPYWLGRFTNGPAWPEYVAMATGLGVQNHSYGGASAAEQEALPGANLYARIRDQGQFFVSGSISLQITDYLERTLSGGVIEKPDATAFVIWAGANDYISKEPARGVITTFLNSPEGAAGYRVVVEKAIAATQEHIRRLYRAGARRFVVKNLPDLGNTPIVLQNTTYSPDYPVPTDTARKLELARRLTQLTLEHNHQLDSALASLREELGDADIIVIDSYSAFSKLTSSSAAIQEQAFGHDLESLRAHLRHEADELVLQSPCYTGSYLGTVNTRKTLCAEPEKAVFWDTVHPSTLTHCWQARSVVVGLEDVGWLGPQPEADDYLSWCRQVVKRVTSTTTGHFSTLPGTE